MTFTREEIAAWARLGLADDVVEDAVDAVADDEFFFERLDVNIGSLFFHRAENQRVDELDDRRVVFGRLENIDRAFEIVSVLELAFDLLDEIGGIALVNAVDRVLNPHAGADDDLDRQPGQRLKVVHDGFIERIGDGDDEDSSPLSCFSLSRSGGLPWSWRS